MAILKYKKILHDTFEVGIIFKGLNGMLETIGGILLYFISRDKLNNIVAFITKAELSEDPKDAIASYFIKLAENISLNGKLFGSVYLLLHGLVKIILVIAVWKRKLWAYPGIIIFLIIFIFYQIYRIIIEYSTGLIILTVFDIVIVALTYWEYNNIKFHSVKIK